MRTQQILPKPPKGVAVEKARKDARKIAEKIEKERAGYINGTRKNFLNGAVLLGIQDMPDIIKKLDALFESEETQSKRGIIILENYLNLFDNDEIWSKIKERYATTQNERIKKEKAIWGNEVFGLIDDLVEKRNKLPFADINYWPVVQDIASLLDHFSSEKELYGIWLQLREKYYAIDSKSRLAFTQEWKYVLVGFRAIQNQVLIIEKAKRNVNSISSYDGQKKWLVVVMDALAKKMDEKKKESNIKMIEIVDSSESEEK